ncbi:TonB-dependent siderophore receptor (plasmid) [Sphingobium sp. V4]|uniref:TonB-dependent siderophore receptor n=1 Tax=Sphingobium sp. V4 TaxID=3038927 RepID=UPI002557EEC6|nr:TonB-dependent siderophore receptor [Sphingobium sp. V4]WIW90543.1 TonB-dependent siderophore receptor [Sphingobium sp. V4]
MRYHQRAALLAATAVAQLLASGLANAEESAEANADTIIVTGINDSKASTGTKTDTPLIATPQSITIIDREELTRRNALSINEALGYVAGVSTNQRGALATRYDQLVLRGFSPGVFLDGMRLIAGPYSTPQIDFNRIDHIDVVKGPASVLYGNSTPGGLVNLTSKMPEATTFGRFEGQIGNYDTFRFAGDVNQLLDAEGRLRARLVAGWQKGDNLAQGTFSERWHVSPMLTFSPDDATSLTLVATYQHTPHGGGYSGTPAAGTVLPNPFGTLPRNMNTGDPGYERYDHKAKSIAAFFRHDFDEHLSFASNFRYQSNKLSYRQIYTSGFATTGTGTNRNSDYSTIVRGGGGADEDFNTLTMDNHLNAKFATGFIQHSLLVGVDYQRITGENVQQFNSGVTSNPLTSIPNLSLFAPVYGGTLPSFDLKILSASYTNTYGKRDQLGVYFQDQMAIGRLQLIASGRQDWYEQTSLNLNPTTAAARAAPVTKLVQSAFTMRLGALYEFEFGLSPYVSYSESFEPQAGTSYVTATETAPFVPITGHQYEAGLKYQPKGINAMFTASIYQLKRQGNPVSDPRAGTGGIPANATVQIGETRVRGGEFEGRGEVIPGFDIVATASYTDAVITEGTPAIAATATNSGTPTTTGTRQLGTPKWNASTFLSYDFGKANNAAGALSGLSFGAGVRYVSGSDGTTNYAVISGVTTFQRFHTESFALVDAMLGYDLSKLGLKGWSASINAANLFDKTYISACPFLNSCYYGGPRTVVGSLRFDW